MKKSMIALLSHSLWQNTWQKISKERFNFVSQLGWRVGYGGGVLGTECEANAPITHTRRRQSEACPVLRILSPLDSLQNPDPWNDAIHLHGESFIFSYPLLDACFHGDFKSSQIGSEG